MPTLTEEEIDDLLYYTRTNSTDDLHTTISQLTQSHTNSTPAQILSACIDPENGNTVLHYCAANGLTDLLKTLLGLLEGGLVNRQNSLGNTPLHWGAYNGHLEVVKVLIDEGKADMWVKNAAGHLAMFEAERADRNDVVQYLLEAGGKEVEQTGTEGRASAEDEVDVQNGEEDVVVVAGASTDVADIDMQETGPS